MNQATKKSQNKGLIYRPYGTKGYSWINQNENKIRETPKVLISSIIEKVRIIKKVKKENKTFANTIVAYEELNIAENKCIAEIYALSMMSDNIKVRDASRDALEEFNKSMVPIAYDIKLYQAVMSYVEGNLLVERERGLLDSQDEMLIDDIVKGFKTMGFHLPRESRARIQKIEKEIAKYGTAYDKAVNEYKEFILVDKEELDGIPESIIESFEKVNNKYKLNSQYPIYGPVMKFACNRIIREKLYFLANNKGGINNVKLLEKIIELRREKSSLLGYANHAEYKLEHRMALKSENVYDMLGEILSKLKTKKDAEIAELNVMARQDEIESVKPYDIEYYSNKLKEEKYKYSSEEVKEYFELDHTLHKMFAYFGELFNFDIQEKKLKLWHKDVKHYNILDNDKNVIAELVLDLFPRDGKYGHACMFNIDEGKTISDGKYNYDTPVVTLICNFPKPQYFKINGKNKKTSFVNLSEVETLYHEFGHGLHGLLTTAKYTSHSGTCVVRDFVEVPSQTMEEFLGDPKFLKSISRHYVTGKTMSDKLVDKIISSSKFMNGYKYTRQAVLATLDLDLYTYKSSDPVKHYQELVRKHLVEVDAKVLFVSSFSHIVSGYDAGYYGYLYSERICKDFYSVFKNAGTNKKNLKEIGKRYRAEILEKGGSRSEHISSELFLGRPISNQAFIDDVLG
jgi:Zn-dependent oligopeptidase